jgi:hypothetical protein
MPTIIFIIIFAGSAPYVFQPQKQTHSPVGDTDSREVKETTYNYRDWEHQAFLISVLISITSQDTLIMYKFKI